jgi:hypothetical protein
MFSVEKLKKPVCTTLTGLTFCGATHFPSDEQPHTKSQRAPEMQQIFQNNVTVATTTTPDPSDSRLQRF